MRTVNILKNLGLNDNQVGIYLEILRLGNTRASTLGNRRTMSRTNARHICDQLVKMGLVTSNKKGNTFFYTPEDPEKLSYLLEQQMMALRTKKDDVESIVCDLKAVMNPNFVLPKIKFLTGKRGLLKACEKSLNAQRKEILFAANMDIFRSIVTEHYDIEYYTPTRVKNRINLKLLSVRSGTTVKMRKEDKSQLRRTRFLPEEFFIKNTLLLFDHITTFISNEKYLSCIMIHSQEITDMMRTFFKFMWNNADKK